MRVVTGSPVFLAAAAAALRPLNRPAMSEINPVSRNRRRPLEVAVALSFINTYD
jgi:hypothetical protein